MLWVVPVFTILLVLIYYLFYNASGDNTPLENKDPILTDTAIVVNGGMVTMPMEKSASNTQLSTPEQFKAIAVEEAQSYAYLQVIATPAAMLYINSKEYGSTTAQEQIELASGTYQLTLKNDSFPDYQQEIKLKAGEQKILTIDLRKFSGILKVFTFPWAVVEINGKNYGQTPLEKPIRLKNGSYRLELKNPGFDTYKKSFKINGADTLQVQHNFVNPGLGTIID